MAESLGKCNSLHSRHPHNILDRIGGSADYFPDVLSVFDTFKEAACLWRRNFWYLAVICLIFLGPDFCLTGLLHNVHARHVTHALAPQPTTFYLDLLAGLCAGVALDSAQIAALFGLLGQRPLESTTTAVWRGLTAYTLPLLRLTLLICCCYLPAFGLIQLGFVFWGSVPAIKASVFLSGRLLPLFCSLGLPLIAMENLGALAALKRGFEMTRRHPSYVACCLLLFGLTECAISWSVATHASTNAHGMHWSWTLTIFAWGLIHAIEKILLWTMCLRINASEDPSPLGAEANPAAQDSPFVPDS